MSECACLELSCATSRKRRVPLHTQVPTQTQSKADELPDVAACSTSTVAGTSTATTSTAATSTAATATVAILVWDAQRVHGGEQKLCAYTHAEHCTPRHVRQQKEKLVVYL